MSVPPFPVVIVGNGPSALERPLGPIVDAHLVVVRINNFVLGPEYADSIGSRVDVWAFTWTKMVDRQSRAVPRRMLACPWHAGRYGSVWRNHAEEAWREGLEYLSEVSARMAAEFWDGAADWPSTGAQVIGHFALAGGCSIVGFDHFNARQPDGSIHYGDHCDPTLRHSPDRERGWIAKLEGLGLVTRL